MQRSPQLQLMACCITHQGTRHGQVETANPALAIRVHSSWHRNREDVITSITDRLRKTGVLSAKQKNIAGLELERSQLFAAMATASDQAMLSWKLLKKVIQSGVSG